jgi:hypothetical protein
VPKILFGMLTLFEFKALFNSFGTYKIITLEKFQRS